MKKNFVLDMLLVVSTLLCVGTGIVLDFHLFSGGRAAKMMFTEIHRWTGYLMAVFVVLHFAWHWSWVRFAAKSLLRKKQGRSS